MKDGAANQPANQHDVLYEIDSGAAATVAWLPERLGTIVVNSTKDAIATVALEGDDLEIKTVRQPMRPAEPCFEWVEPPLALWIVTGIG